MLSQITVPWPQDVEDYEVGNYTSVTDFPTVQTFFANPDQPVNFTNGFSNFALRAKASALFEQAVELSTAWDAQPHGLDLPLTNTVGDDVQALENTINRFSSSLLPIQQLNGTLAADKQSLVVVHTLAQAAIIRLHYRYGGSDHVRHERCLRAARACLFIIRHIGDSDYSFLDPIIGSCWGSAANVLVREITRIETWSAVSSAELRTQLSTIVAAMSKLSLTFPLLGFQVAKIQSSMGAL